MRAHMASHVHIADALDACLPHMPPTRRTGTPKRSSAAHSEGHLDATGLAAFAVEAVTVVREQCGMLYRQSSSNSFSLELKSLLSNVITRLNKPEKLIETRVIELLCALERIVRVSGTSRHLNRKDFKHHLTKKDTVVAQCFPEALKPVTT
jgi:hypothetical protein